MYMHEVDVEKIRELLDRNEYPSEYEPEEWEEYINANCYSYSINLKVNRGFLIGDFIGKRVTYKDSMYEQIEVLKEELDALGFYVEECETTDLVDEGTFKIYIEWDSKNFYHFIRQDDSGIWSHKAAYVLPLDLDEYGNVMTNPEYGSRRIITGKCFALTRSCY